MPERMTEDAWRHLIEPLAAVFVRLGIGVGEFATVCKAAYVAVAADKVRSQTGRVNRSRIAVITGLTRAEVTRLLAGGRALSRQPWHRHRAARVLDGWFLDPAFRTREGRPKDLPKKGKALSFRALVRRYGGDVPVRAVLEELLSSDAIEVRSNGLLRAKRRALTGRGLSSKAIAEIGTTTGQLLATLIHNCEHPNDRWFESKVMSARVDSALVPYLRKTISERGTALLDALRDQLEKPPTDIARSSPPSSPVTLSVGMYLNIRTSKMRRASA
jgi:hypothetical protein